jgi:hypothetical protein
VTGLACGCDDRDGVTGVSALAGEERNERKRKRKTVLIIDVFLRCENLIDCAGCAHPCDVPRFRFRFRSRSSPDTP